MRCTVPNRGRRVCQQLPAGTTTCGTWRAIRPVVRSGMGYARSVFSRVASKCKQVDQPIAALIKDLRTTRSVGSDIGCVVGRVWPHAVWPGTTMAVGKRRKRDATTTRMRITRLDRRRRCQARIQLWRKPMKSVTRSPKNPVHVHDFNATLLHLLGINHERLTFRYQGRQYRLTDVEGRVINQVIA